MTRILGLDASTTTIGLAVVDYKNNEFFLVHHEFFKPPKDGDIFERLFKVKEFIIQKLNDFKPDEVVIEDIILFMKGRSNAQTISSLAIFNRTVGLTVLEHLKKSPHLLNVMKIRHTLKKDKKLPSKEEMPELVASYLNIQFPWIYKLNKKTKKQTPIVENFDMADAMACACCYLLLEKKVKKSLKIKKKSS